VSYAAFYDSFIQHPLLLWVAALVGLLVAMSRRGLSRSVRWFCVVLTVVSALDAWLTGIHVVGFGTLTGAPATLVPLTFVLVGDFRYFFFIESVHSDGTLVVSLGRVARACAWTLVTPIGSQLLTNVLGSNDPRVLFLVYETLFVGLSVFVATIYLPRHSEALRWTRGVTGLVFGYYALWALADATILGTKADMGFLLRVFPNVLYYGGLVPALAWTAPRATSPQSGS